MRFLLVDRLAPLAEGMRGHKLAAMSEDYFEWHFPGRPIVPGMLILEAAVQTAGWWVAQQTAFREWLLLQHVETARYYAFAVPGDAIQIDIRLHHGTYEATCTLDGHRNALLAFRGARVPLADFMDPMDARRSYAQLTRTEETP